jgi:hypothetical protein
MRNTSLKIIKSLVSMQYTNSYVIARKIPCTETKRIIHICTNREHLLFCNSWSCIWAGYDSISTVSAFSSSAFVQHQLLPGCHSSSDTPPNLLFHLQYHPMSQQLLHGCHGSGAPAKPSSSSNTIQCLGDRFPMMVNTVIKIVFFAWEKRSTCTICSRFTCAN